MLGPRRRREQSLRQTTCCCMLHAQPEKIHLCIYLGVVVVENLGEGNERREQCTTGAPFPHTTSNQDKQGRSNKVGPERISSICFTSLAWSSVAKWSAKNGDCRRTEKKIRNKNIAKKRINCKTENQGPVETTRDPKVRVRCQQSQEKEKIM